MTDNDRDVAMQTRCLYCLREQYAPAVLMVSYGDVSCAWCHADSEQMTRAQYQRALSTALERRGR